MANLQKLARREFVIKVGSVAAVLATGSVLSGCGGGNDEDPPQFNFGVASGDPLTDRVILWTHAKYPGVDNEVVLSYEVANDAGFTRIVSTGTARATTATGFTAKVDATGLSPGQSYFYRFRRGAHNSPVGQTRTLPASDVASVKFAVLSCSNYPAGFFNVYADVAKNPDIQYAIHLGDYIYEYAADGYASALAASLGRSSVPEVELTTLDHYRLRHAQYKSDVDAKTLHAAKPMIAVWDDHEVANDAYKGGAENHQENEGDWQARKAAALQAYHEWMPIRTGSNRERLYRSFNFGNLVSLHMLDTRLIGRDKQIDILDLAGLKGDEARAAAFAQYTSPTRQLLGVDQLQWLQGQMAASSATWQVLGQQVLMARIEAPASVLSVLNPANTSPEAIVAGQQAVNAYVTAKLTPAEFRDPTQQALMDETLNPKLGYNLDAWDGYLAAREGVLGTAYSLGKRLVTLAGDTHNAWHSDLTLKLGVPGLAGPGTKVGEEFATSSVSSPGFEGSLSAIPSAQLEQIFLSIVDDLNYLDASRRGYLLMTFSAEQAKGEWFFVDTIASRTYTTVKGHEAIYSG